MSNILRSYIKAILKENKEFKTPLDVFDFDSTLYESPQPPPNYSGPYWWGSKTSLETLNQGLWIEETVQDAMHSIKDHTHLSVMLTARAARTDLMFIINKLLREKGLMFDRTFFKNTQQKSPIFKAELVGMLLDAYPNIAQVNLWEDNEDNIKAIENKCLSLSVDFNFTLV